MNGQEGASDPESQALVALGRSMPAPQGIGVADSSGRALVWTLGFEGEPAVQGFLDHAKERFAATLDPARSLSVERFRTFPGEKMPDVDAGARAEIPAHADGASCPSRQRTPLGTLVARVVGRALDEKGVPVADTTHQESYVEDRFEIAADEQAAVAQALGAGERVRIPDEVARTLVGHALLGMLDVGPRAPGAELHAELFATPSGVGFRVEGRSTFRVSSVGRPDDGASFEHGAELAWEGWLELDGLRVKRLLLEAHGHERLRWRGGEDDSRGRLAHLTAGRPLDGSGQVRYGIVAEPVAEGDAVSAGTPQRAVDGAAVHPAREVAIQRKAKALEKAVASWQAQGRDPTPIGRLVEPFEGLIRAGRVDEAESLLDRALALATGSDASPSPDPKPPATAGGTGPSPDPKPPATAADSGKSPDAKTPVTRSPEDPLRGVRERLEKVRARVEALVRAGKLTEAEQALDRALEALGKAPD